MGIYISNISSLSAMRYLTDSSNALDRSYQRLASGKRINSARDDPAGLQICSRLTSEINGLEQGRKNALDGMSFAQTAEGALDEVNNMLQRVRVLAIQSSNGTNSDADRQALNNEANQLFEEINRISTDTTFGGQKLLDGSRGIVSIQVGAYANQTIDIDMTKGFDLKSIAERAGNGASDVFKNGFDLSTAESSQKVLGHIDDLIKDVNGHMGTLGGIQNRFESTIRYSAKTAENLAESRSRIQDTDYAAEVSTMIQNSIMQQSAMAVLSQANQRNNIILALINSAFGR